MTTYTTPEAIAEEYRETSRRLMGQADEEFEKGDLLQASEKAWGAASQCLKAMAALRGIQHASHWELRLVANHMVNETGHRRIRELFAVGESLHANFYEAWMPEEEVSDGIDNMKELVAFLERVPPPNGVASARPPRARTFFRDRGDG